MALESRITQFRRILETAVATDGRGTRQDLELAMGQFVELLSDLRSRKKRLYVIGNGGSAGVAGHAVTDFLNVGKLRAATLHDPALFTCMSNDYGYDAAFARILETVAEAGDLLIAISSSGKSANIRNAASVMRRLDGSCITLSGFDESNPLRSLGNLNFWLDSKDYGMVEIGHQFILHNIADRLRVGVSNKD